MARADALALASPTASTIEALRALHPSDDHSPSRHAPAFCPLEALGPPPPPPGSDPSEPLKRASFHEVFFRRLPRCSAADHGGWRYEYLSSTYRYLSTQKPDAPPGAPSSFIPGRGAEALWRLCTHMYSGNMPASVRPWFLGGRLIALAKPGDKPDKPAAERKLRPIAIGSTMGRTVSMVAAHQYKSRFASFLQPPPPGSTTQPPTQPDGSPWPAQVGVACHSGLEFTTHSVRT